LITLAGAIQAAHDAEIIHRDLKPSNILFTVDGIPKITDFGLAKRLESDSHQTESGQIMGTPCYMAPEQALGRTRDLGPAADIYALGAILYEMLTGRPPFKGETPIETVRQVISDDVVPPGRLVPKVARDLETICLHCLNKEQFKRYRSARELAADLERFLAGTPIKARPTPLWERGVKLARRRPVATTLCTLGLLATIATTAGWTRYSSVQRFKERQDFLERTGLRTNKALALVDAQKALALEQYSQAKPILTGIQGEIGKEVGFEDLRMRVGEMLAECERGLAAQATQSEDRKKLTIFRDRRWDALRRETQFTGLDIAVDPEEFRRSTLAALEVFAAPGSEGHWTLGPLPASLDQAAHEEIKGGCYELLLILVEAIKDPEEGLRLLDQAAGLRPPTRVYHLRRADLLARRGDAALAQRQREQADLLPAASALDHFLIGKEHCKQKQWSAALAHFGVTLRDQPGHFWAHCLSAISDLQIERPYQAQTELTACLQLEERFAWLYELRGFASYQIAVKSRQAHETLQTKGTLLRDEIKLQREAAEADFARALELLEQKPNDELQYALLVNRGLLRLECREWDKAVKDLEAAIRLSATHWEAFEVLAEVYDREAKPDQAIEQFTRAITLRPKLAALYRARAQVEMRRTEQTQAQRERARADLETAIALEPDRSPFLAGDQTNRAHLLHREGREAAALAACEAALEADPNFLLAHRQRIDLLRNLKRHSEVINSCDALLTRSRPAAEIYELRALAKQELNDYLGAIEDDTMAIAMQPGNATLLARRGGLHLLTDAPRSALRDFEKAIALDPASPSAADAYLGRGLARATLGLHREAIADASRAGRLGESTHLRLYTAARIYAKAAVAATGDVRKTPQDGKGLVIRYQDQAVELLRQAVSRLPAAERPAFVRDVVQADPALGTLRHRLRSLDLADAAARPASPEQQPRN